MPRAMVPVMDFLRYKQIENARVNTSATAETLTYNHACSFLLCVDLESFQQLLDCTLCRLFGAQAGQEEDKEQRPAAEAVVGQKEGVGAGRAPDGAEGKGAGVAPAKGARAAPVRRPSMLRGSWDLVGRL